MPGFFAHLFDQSVQATPIDSGPSDFGQIQSLGSLAKSSKSNSNANANANINGMTRSDSAHFTLTSTHKTAFESHQTTFPHKAASPHETVFPYKAGFRHESAFPHKTAFPDTGASEAPAVDKIDVAPPQPGFVRCNPGYQCVSRVS
jgi:hypothetical protein